MEASSFPSSPRSGARDTNKTTRSILSGADGVVYHSQNKHGARFVMGSPPRLRAKKRAQPPLLGEEGKTRLPRSATAPKTGTRPVIDLEIGRITRSLNLS